MSEQDQSLPKKLLGKIDVLESYLTKTKTKNLSRIKFDQLKIIGFKSNNQNHIDLVNKYNKLLDLLKAKHAPAPWYATNFFKALVGISTSVFVINDTYQNTVPATIVH